MSLADTDSAIKPLIDQAQRQFASLQAKACGETALDIIAKATALGDQLSLGYGQFYLGYSKWNQKDLAGGMEGYLQALSTGKLLNDLPLQAKVCYMIGSNYREVNLFDRAKEYLQLSASLYRQLQQQEPDKADWILGEAKSITILGQVYEELKDGDTSEQLLLRSIELKQLGNHAQGVAYSQFSLGMVYIKQNKPAAAKELLGMALEVLTHPFYQQYCNVGLGILAKQEADWPKAISLLEEVIEQTKDTPEYVHAYLLALERIPSCYEAVGDYQKAYETLRVWSQLMDERFSHSNVDAISLLEAEHQKSKREQELQEWQLAHARASLTALKAQMNPHFIFNAMNAIGNNMSQENLVETQRMLNSFAVLMRQNLDMADKETVLLQEEIDFLTNYLEVEKMRFGGKLQYKITVDEEVEPELTHIPSMLVQPYVENALKHGLHPKQGTGLLEIIFTETNTGQLLCTIRDNGVGRAKAKEIKERNAAFTGKAHESKGMKITEARLNIINQTATNTVSVVVNDLYDNSGAATGTEVTISIKC